MKKSSQRFSGPLLFTTVKAKHHFRERLHSNFGAGEGNPLFAFYFANASEKQPLTRIYFLENDPLIHEIVTNAVTTFQRFSLRISSVWQNDLWGIIFAKCKFQRGGRKK